MTKRSTDKVRRLMMAAGLDPPERINVERTYAGHNQRSIGWCVWIARDADTGRILCGSTFPIRMLQINRVESYIHPTTSEVEIIPSDLENDK